MENNNSVCLDTIINQITSSDRQIKLLTSGIAKRVHFAFTFDLFKGRFADVYAFSDSLGFNKKTTNAYLNVIERFYDYDINKMLSYEYKSEYYKIKDNVKGFNFSQLKACLGLSDKEIVLLEIDNKSTVREIEKRKKELKVHLNNIPFSDCSGVPPDQSENDCMVYTSTNDCFRSIKNPFSLGYIPEQSEYLYIFDGKNSMVKGSKLKRNVITALKKLREDIENNTDDTICYAVVKIRKGNYEGDS